MPRKFRRDTRAESVMRPFLILLGVMMLFAIISTTLIHHMAGSAESVNSGVSQSLLDLGLYEYELIEPDTGYAITTANTTNHMVHPHDSSLQFIDDEGDIKYVQIIRDNVDYDPTSMDLWKRYNDFISIQRETSDLFGLVHSWREAAIPLDTVVAKFDEKTNMSIVGFTLTGYNNDTLFFILPNNNSAMISANSYSLYYGWSLIRPERVDFWGTINMILTGEIPGLDSRIQFVLSAFWMFSLIYIGFVMVRSITPFLSGG